MNKSSLSGKVLVFAESAADANLLIDTLASTQLECFACIASDDPEEALSKRSPDVLLLVHRSLSRAEALLHRLFRSGGAGDRSRYRVLVLCSNEEVKEAFRLCLENVADDYVQFWPMPWDGFRLRLAIRGLLRQQHAQRELRSATQALQRASQYPPGSASGSTVPDGSAAAQPAPELALDAAEPGASDAPVPKTTVLLVDDDPFQYRTTRLILSSLPLKLLWASSGAQAFELAQAGRLDMILLDINMPGLDGIETLRGFRATPQLKDVPIIMLTGNSERTRVMQSLSAGATGFVVKPFTKALMSDLVTKHLPHLLSPEP